jgi:2OG-Fe(II) oxygenase superfamily
LFDDVPSWSFPATIIIESTNGKNYLSNMAPLIFWKRALNAACSRVSPGRLGAQSNLYAKWLITTSTTQRSLAPTIPSQFRYSSSAGGLSGSDPVLDSERLQQSILDLAPLMALGLAQDGYWTITGDAILPKDIIGLLRNQACELRKQGRYEQSWSERVVGGVFKQRFDKEGVFACEPDGRDYETAPDMIVYMSVLLQTLPSALNKAIGAMSSDQPHPDLSNSSFNAKLAVTLPGGSTYPLHVDNPQGLVVNDTRKLTCILYLNPDYESERGDGGELRLVLGKDGAPGDETKLVDLTPEGGRMVLFWSDEIPHEVLPTAPDYVSSIGNELQHSPLDRYALTIWIPTDDFSAIHNESSKFRLLRDLAFPQS